MRFASTMLIRGLVPLLTVARIGLGRVQELCAALSEPHDHDVEHGRKKKTEAGYSKHSEEDGRTECLPHFCAGAFAENKWEDTKNEGKGSHQNRTQSEAASFDRGGETIFAVAILDLFREL